MRTNVTIWAAGCIAVFLAASSQAASLNLFEPVQLAPGTYLLAPTIPGEAQVGVIIGERSVAGARSSCRSSARKATTLRSSRIKRM